MSGKEFDIYDLMYKDRYGRWISKIDYDTLEEAIECNPGIYIEDKRK